MLPPNVAVTESNSDGLSVEHAPSTLIGRVHLTAGARPMHFGTYIFHAAVGFGCARSHDSGMRH